MLELALLRRPSFAGLLGGALVLQAAAFSGLLFVSLWLQDVLHLSPIRGGLALMPLAGASFAVAAAAGRYTHRLAPRWPIGVGLLLIGAGSLVLWASVSASSGQTSLFTGLAIIGAGVGLSTPVLVSAAVESVPPQRAGMAGGAINTFRQLGMTLGIALFGAVFSARLRHVQAGGGTRRAAYAAGLDRISLYAALGAFLAAALVLLLVRRAAHPVTTPGPAAPGDRDETGARSPDVARTVTN
jgi:MFS family permease